MINLLYVLNLIKKFGFLVLCMYSVYRFWYSWECDKFVSG